MSRLLRSSLLLAACVAAAHAALLRVEVAERADVLDGREFGAAGPYERVTGKAYFSVDPALPANRIVADLDQAPRNENGLVEFSSDIYVLRPRDPRRGNGALIYEVSNRGGKGMLSMFNLASRMADPPCGSELGDCFLLEQGYTLVWVGWQFDVPERPGLLRLRAPVAKGITGVVRSEIVVDKRQDSASVADRSHIPYLVKSPNDPALALTVRDAVNGPRKTLPRSSWKIEESSRIVLKGGFEPGRLYELVYTSEDPAVVGLGPAAIRDFISFLRYGGNGVTMFGDMSRAIKRAYGFGVSQSGRFLRTFLYYGFNQDEKSRKVFDGMLVHVAGAGRGSFNHRFAQPSRDGHPFMNTLFPTDIFPFSDVEQRDPETSLSDGIRTHNTPAAAQPKIFYTNSSYEYYGRAASLIHTSLDGKKDAPVPADTRVYLFAGGQHGPATFPPKRANTLNLPNPNPYTLSMRALLVAMDRWVRDGVEPPPSQYPRIGAGQAVPLAALEFPKIPGIRLPQRPQLAYRADYGPDFRARGIVTQEPPKLGNAFPVLVPQVDADGNETSGVRTPLLQYPLATFTGWNMRTKEIGAPAELYSMIGSWIPFARTKAERTKSGDPRPSIEERYATRAEYLEKVGAAARTLVERGYLLDRDVARAVEQAAAQWDYFARQ
jgi:hypothetical protein